MIINCWNIKYWVPISYITGSLCVTVLYRRVCPSVRPSLCPWLVFGCWLYQNEWGNIPGPFSYTHKRLQNTHIHTHMHTHAQAHTCTCTWAKKKHQSAARITEIAVPSDCQKDTNAKPQTRTHMHKASAEINKIRVRRWRGFTQRTQTHRDRHTCAYASIYAHTNAVHVPQYRAGHGSNIKRNQTCFFIFGPVFLYFFSITLFRDTDTTDNRGQKGTKRSFDFCQFSAFQQPDPLEN